MAKFFGGTVIPNDCGDVSKECKKYRKERNNAPENDPKFSKFYEELERIKVTSAMTAYANKMGVYKNPEGE
jgi:hypothetical protein